MNFSEILQDKRLGIQTIGRDDTYADEHHSPYEPTPYCVLDRMAGNNVFDHISHLVDFGCGKGRVGFYLAEKYGIRITGIEVENVFYKAATKNLSRFGRKTLIRFENCPAETCLIPTDADAFFFFRPFSEIILRRVMHNILGSYYEYPRPMRFIFYYINASYALYLESIHEISPVLVKDCRDLFQNKVQKDKFIVYQIGQPLNAT